MDNPSEGNTSGGHDTVDDRHSRTLQWSIQYCTIDVAGYYCNDTKLTHDTRICSTIQYI